MEQEPYKEDRIAYTTGYYGDYITFQTNQPTKLILILAYKPDEEEYSDAGCDTNVHQNQRGSSDM